MPIIIPKRLTYPEIKRIARLAGLFAVPAELKLEYAVKMQQQTNKTFTKIGVRLRRFLPVRCGSGGSVGGVSVIGTFLTSVLLPLFGAFREKLY